MVGVYFKAVVFRYRAKKREARIRVCPPVHPKKYIDEQESNQKAARQPGELKPPLFQALADLITTQEIIMSRDEH
jgi:hypothetical protein